MSRVVSFCSPSSSLLSLASYLLPSFMPLLDFLRLLPLPLFLFPLHEFNIENLQALLLPYLELPPVPLVVRHSLIIFRLFALFLNLRHAFLIHFSVCLAICFSFAIKLFALFFYLRSVINISLNLHPFPLFWSLFFTPFTLHHSSLHFHYWHMFPHLHIVT